MPSSVTYLNRTPIFKWCVVRSGSKNGHQKGTCSKVIELHAQNMLGSLAPILNMIWVGEPI